VELEEDREKDEDAGENSEGLLNDWSAGWVKGVADERV
jgi:hypothetical protein